MIKAKTALRMKLAKSSAPPNGIMEMEAESKFTGFHCTRYKKSEVAVVDNYRFALYMGKISNSYSIKNKI